MLEAAVVDAPNADSLIKPKAWAVLKSGVVADDELAAELQKHVRGQLVARKYPRRIEFFDELPETATGKIQRFRLR